MLKTTDFPTPSRSFSIPFAGTARSGPPSGAAFARFGVPTFPRANFFAASRRIGAGTSSSTRPILFARLESTTFPARMTSSAAVRPTTRGRRVVPPHAGRIPSLISGRPICVFFESDASRQSIARTVSQPPPRQAPSIAATVGNGRFASFPRISCPRRTPLAIAAGSVTSAISFTSAPAMKMSGLPETRRSAFTPFLFARPSRTPSSSRRTCAEYLLTFSPGRSNVRTARPSASTSSRKAFGASAITPPPRGRSSVPGRRRCRASRRRSPSSASSSPSGASG